MSSAALIFSLQALLFSSQVTQARDLSPSTSRAGSRPVVVGGTGALAAPTASCTTAAGRRHLFGAEVAAGASVAEAWALLQALAAESERCGSGPGPIGVEALFSPDATRESIRSLVEAVGARVPGEAAREQLWSLVWDDSRATWRRLAALRSLRGDLPTREADRRLDLVASPRVPGPLAIEAAGQLRLVAAWLSPAQLERVAAWLDLPRPPGSVRRLAAAILASGRPAALVPHWLELEDGDPLLAAVVVELRGRWPARSRPDVVERLRELVSSGDAGGELRAAASRALDELAGADDLGLSRPARPEPDERRARRHRARTSE